MITKANPRVKDLPRLGVEPQSPDPQPWTMMTPFMTLHKVYWIALHNFWLSVLDKIRIKIVKHYFWYFMLSSKTPQEAYFRLNIIMMLINNWKPNTAVLSHHTNFLLSMVFLHKNLPYMNRNWQCFKSKQWKSSRNSIQILEFYVWTINSRKSSWT